MAKAHTFRDPIFQDAASARKALEALLWPDGPFCRRCGNSDPDKIAKLQASRRALDSTTATIASAGHRDGWHCP